MTERISGNSNTIDWKVLLNSIESGQGVSETQGQNQKVNLVLSEGDKDILLNLLTTPDIDAPGGMETTPADKLASLIGKLQDGKTFNFTEAQTKTFVDTLSTLQQKVAALNASGTQGTQKTDAASTPLSSNTSKILFDIYKMLALLIECAQDMKNAQREQRQSENSAQITAIQNQADAQRTAALTGLIAGSICCAIQVVATGVAAAKTISNTRAEVALGNEFNVNQSATELGQAQSDAKTAQLELKNFTQEHPVPAEGQAPEAPDITQQRAELQAKVDETKAAVAEKRLQFESSKQLMKHSEGYDALQEKQAWTRATFDISQAFGNFAQTMVRGFVDLKQAEAMSMSADQKKAEEALEQTKDLMASFQDVIDAVGQLAQAVLAAENESMRNAIQA